jgi:hypothetical protein
MPQVRQFNRFRLMLPRLTDQAVQAFGRRKRYFERALHVRHGHVRCAPPLPRSGSLAPVSFPGLPLLGPKGHPHAGLRS